MVTTSTYGDGPSYCKPPLMLQAETSTKILVSMATCFNTTRAISGHMYSVYTRMNRWKITQRE